MLDRQLHKFYISYKINVDVHLEWVEGINLRHAKERIEMMHEEATDLMDWTHESEEDLKAYLHKVDEAKRKHEEDLKHSARKN